MKYSVRWLRWAQALNVNETLDMLTLEFLRCVKHVFDQRDYASSAADQLFVIWQWNKIS